MKVSEQQSIKSFNTFGIDVTCNYFLSFDSVHSLLENLTNSKYDNIPKMILGGGSNVLFTQHYNGMILHNEIKGIEVIQEDAEFVFVKVGAGVVWHDLVLYCLENNFAGIENLSLIPGNVGAAPMQNIGAYGVELKEVFYELEAMDMASHQLKKFSKEDCQFGYRESVFKNKFKGDYIITSVTLQLHKKPNFNTSYGAIEEELKNMNVNQYSIQAISQAVCNIRRSKLPDPKILGNAGSFFKNPIISSSKFENLKDKFPSIIAYHSPNNMMKLSAGWMIEYCGWKGKKIGNAGMHKDQALVLINYGGASGHDLLNLSKQVQESVHTTFDVWLEPEVNII